MSYEDEYATDHLHVAQEMLGLIDNLHGDELDQAADLERGASAHALVDIAQSLRLLNEGRDQWYREVLGVLTEAKKPSRCGVVFGEDVFHGTELRCTLDSGHAGFHDDSNDEGSPVGSGQPAAAPDGELEPTPCVVCGKEGNRYRVCLKGATLTKDQWQKHAEDEYDEAREYGAGKDTAWARAIEKTSERFGPCPEES